MCSSRKFRSFMAFLLALVMVAGMAPTALAASGTGTGGSSNIGTPTFGSTSTGFGYVTPYDIFTRYTLVRFIDSDGDGSIDWETDGDGGYHTYYNNSFDYGVSSRVIGSVDISAGMYRQDNSDIDQPSTAH